MSVDVQVPRLAESISEAVLVEWLKPNGAQVAVDEPIATLETDKAAVEIAATESGVLEHAKQVGEKVVVGDVLARIAPGGAKESAAAASHAAARPAQREAEAKTSAASSAESSGAAAAAGAPSRAPARSGPPAGAAQRGEGSETGEPALSPAVRKMVEEHGLDPLTIEATGRGGRLLKDDVLRHLERLGGNGAKRGGYAPPLTSSAPQSPATAAPAPASPTPASPTPASAAPASSATASAAPASPAPAATQSAPSPDRTSPGADERVVPMSRIRQRIAERLVHAQQTAAILTTFNEIDMTAVMELRAKHRESFEKRHGVRLGFLSFFTRACVLALEEVPELNAAIRGTDIVYKTRVHMGVAVGTERGLVVPVVRDARRLSFAEIEREILRLAERARENTLSLDELSGGTFTISNGGVYGSLLSTPILNPPQSGILGMHKIEKRPIAVNDQVAIRPMMYVALSYDHRIVDGEQAVTFLVRVKERLEDPERMLLDV